MPVSRRGKKKMVGRTEGKEGRGRAKCLGLEEENSYRDERETLQSVTSVSSCAL